MATPRVFISSTCFDLAEVRDSLVSFCSAFGFDVALSEKGDVFYHPDLHTHESCINEVSNCQLFVLIIGGRFGGKYKIDSSKSVTNAEYLCARELGIPVFTFIKQDVLSDHHVYVKNRGKNFSEEIDYPSIETKEYSARVFEFIDSVRGSDVNNGFFGFRFARDLQENLRKQWSGMFFDFLTNRSISNQLKSTNESITNLSLASKKIEELVKQVYRQVDAAGAEDSISAIDTESEATKFFTRIGEKISTSKFIPNDLIEKMATSPSDKWYDFLLAIEGFDHVEEVYSEDDRQTSALIHSKGAFIADISGDLSKSEIELLEKLEQSYSHFAAAPESIRKKVLEKFVVTVANK